MKLDWKSLGAMIGLRGKDAGLPGGASPTRERLRSLLRAPTLTLSILALLGVLAYQEIDYRTGSAIGFFTGRPDVERVGVGRRVFEHVRRDDPSPPAFIGRLILGLAWSPDSRSLVTMWQTETRCQVFDTATWKIRFHVDVGLNWSAQSCSAAVFSADSRYLITRSVMHENKAWARPEILAVWDAQTGALVKEVGGLPATHPTRLRADQSGRYVAGIFFGNRLPRGTTLALYDGQTFEFLREIYHREVASNPSLPMDLDFDPLSERLAIGMDSHISVLRMPEVVETASISNGVVGADRIGFSHDGEWLLAGGFGLRRGSSGPRRSYEGNLTEIFHHSSEGGAWRTDVILSEEPMRLNDMSYNGRGRLLAIAGYIDTTVWDLANRRRLWLGPKARAVAISPNGKFLALSFDSRFSVYELFGN